ncbi:hypothetical protein KA107_01305 [Candidatus Pacearchaeota archaeon]|nr:hypothetical protein [Candidatus Pacearchaeota archaeon]
MRRSSLETVCEEIKKINFGQWEFKESGIAYREEDTTGKHDYGASFYTKNKKPEIRFDIKYTWYSEFSPNRDGFFGEGTDNTWIANCECELFVGETSFKEGSEREELYFLYENHFAKVIRPKLRELALRRGEKNKAKAIERFSSKALETLRDASK